MTKQTGQSVFLFLFTVAMTLLFSLFAGTGTDAALRNAVAGAIIALVTLFLLRSRALTGALSKENARHTGRFAICYVVALVCALLLTRIDAYLWAYMAIFAALMYCSDAVIGFFTGASLLLLSTLFLSGDAFAAFGAYLLSGAIAIALFATIDQETRLTQAAFACALTQTVLLIAFRILMLHTEIRLSIFVMPIINGVVSFGLLFALARYYLTHIAQGDKAKYAEINDTEFALMAAIRAKSKDAYFRAIHTAYLVDKVADDLNLNAGAAKACASYKEIGCLDDKESDWYEVEHYYTEFEFPAEATDLLKEYLTMGRVGPKSKEATVVLLCERLVQTLTELFQKNKDARVDYDETIGRLFDDTLASDYLAQSALSIREYEQAKMVLQREKLYYDFLR